jgi:hypothetical protein
MGGRSKPAILCGALLRRNTVGYWCRGWLLLLFVDEGSDRICNYLAVISHLSLALSILLARQRDFLG